MDLERFRQFCLAKPGVTEERPFGPDVLVFKVAGKMFALAPLEYFASVNLKCDPDRAVELRAQYPGITPGYLPEARSDAGVEARCNARHRDPASDSCAPRR
ncbi:MAG: MmcQ/YjbR family DNA-binding protein [Flavobacteriales bacterium]|nr:MmcQ/YjbR family DNA-binding protein [Flavobacteriales bacterium]